MIGTLDNYATTSVMLLFLGICLLTGCEQRQDASPASTALTNCIDLDRDNIEFGHVFIPTTCTAEIVLHNRSPREVKILNTKTSCDCTMITPTTKTIAAKGSASVSVIYTVEQVGLRKQVVGIQCDDGERNILLQAKISAIGENPIKLVPDSIAMTYDRLTQEWPSWDQTIELRQPGAELIAVSCSIPDMTTQQIDSQKFDDGVTRARWHIAATKQLPGGLVSGRLDISYKDAKDAIENTNIPISIEATGPLRFSENTVQMGIIDKTPKLHPLSVKSQNGHDFKILDVTCDIGDIKARWDTSKNSTEHSIEVAYKGSLNDRKSISGVITVTTTLPGGDSWKLPIKGFVLK